MANKYVHSKYECMLTCKLEAKGDIEAKDIVFYPYEMNNYTGVATHTGYTEVSEEDLDRLKKESSLYQAFTKQKYLTVVDDLPSSFKSSAAIMLDKDKELHELRAKVAKLEAGGDTSGNEELTTVKAELEAAQAAVSAANEKIAKLTEELEKTGKPEGEPAEGGGKSGKSGKNPRF